LFFMTLGNLHLDPRSGLVPRLGDRPHPAADRHAGRLRWQLRGCSRFNPSTPLPSPSPTGDGRFDGHALRR